MKIQFQKLFPDITLPTYTHSTDAGMDLRTRETKTLIPGERCILPTGFAMAIPEGYVGLVWDRSGLAIKEGLTCLAGVVDAGYRGEVGVVVLNTSDKNIEIEKGDRVAQMLIQPVEICDIEIVDQLSNSERGEGGFGASGKK